MVTVTEKRQALVTRLTELCAKTWLEDTPESRLALADTFLDEWANVQGYIEELQDELAEVREDLAGREEEVAKADAFWGVAEAYVRLRRDEARQAHLTDPFDTCWTARDFARAVDDYL